MTLTTAQQRRHAELLRERDSSPEAVAVAAEIEAEAELDDALQGREVSVADSARMVEEYPILGKISREGGKIVDIEHPWEDAHVARARSVGVDIAWEWCHDPMAGLRQGELIRIFVGTEKTGPLLQWDRHSRRWQELSNQRRWGNNWACGGNWSARDKVGSATIKEAISKLSGTLQEQLKRAFGE